MKHIRKARELKEEYSGDIKNLIERAINDIISLCKYIDMTAPVIDYQDDMDILTKRIGILKDLIENLNTENHELSNFYYLPGADLIPQILRTIESYDVTTYRSVADLLNNLAENKSLGKLFYITEEIEIYAISNNSHTILFSRKNGEIIIINVYNSLTLANLEGELTKATINKIREIHNMKKTPEYKNLNANYENLVSCSLNLSNPETEVHELKKER